MAGLTYGDLASLDYNFNASSSSGSGSSGITSTDIDNIAKAVWNYGNSSGTDLSGRTITGDVTVNPTQANTFLTATGFATPTTVSTAVTDIENHGDNKWATATGFITSSDLSGLATSNEIDSLSDAIADAGGLTNDQEDQLAKIFALLANWSVSGTTLTATLGANSTCSFTLTKNNDGEITGVSPTST